MTIEENKAYICQTEETAKKFISLCESQNIIWGSGMPVKSSDSTNWGWFEDNTCYILVNGHLMFGPYPKWVDEFGYKPVYVDGNRPTKFVLDEKAMLCLQEAIVSQFCPDCDYCGYDVVDIVKEVFKTHKEANTLYSIDYHKQSDTTKEIFQSLYDRTQNYHGNRIILTGKDIKELAATYGVEVEE